MLLIFVALADEIGTADVSNGAVQGFSIESAPYGAVTGTIRFRLGNWTWYPEEVWLVPEGEVDDYRYTNKYYQIASSVGNDPILNATNRCRTSVYNLTDKKGFKSSIGAGGTFCVLADQGRYKIYAK
ncbi:MAG: hypothetical protein HZB67_05840 [Candidatus Aenigmarchaeota archaeon]|nr:hypothetical protein [Candidatus Aenigmarchaeota archaeon]